MNPAQPVGTSAGVSFTPAPMVLQSMIASTSPAVSAQADSFERAGLTAPTVQVRPVGIVGRTLGRFGSLMGKMFGAFVLATGVFLLGGCPTNVTYVNMKYPHNDERWTGQVRRKSPCTDTRLPPRRARLNMLRRTCLGKIVRDEVTIEQCSPRSWRWSVDLVCRSSDPYDADVYQGP